MTQLKLGVPKGSLEEATIALFRQAGWQIQPRSRNYFPTIDDPEISCALVRSQEMATYVSKGVLDVGLTGLDWILDSGAQVEEVCDLIYSKSSDQPCRWVLVVPQDSDIQRLEDLQGKRVATELVNFTRTYMQERGAHGLRIVCDLLHTHTRLIASPAAMADPWKKQKIEDIALLLQASLAAHQKVALKMNAPKAKLGEITALLPSLHAPTVSDLADTDWVALETVVDRDQVRSLIPDLRKRGAEGILEYELRKII